jgi:hypothetical protein
MANEMHAAGEGSSGRRAAGARLALACLVLASSLACSSPVATPTLEFDARGPAPTLPARASVYISTRWRLALNGSARPSVLRGGGAADATAAPPPPRREQTGAASAAAPDADGARQGRGRRWRGRALGAEERRYAASAAAAFDLTYPALLTRTLPRGAAAHPAAAPAAGGASAPGATAGAEAAAETAALGAVWVGFVRKNGTGSSRVVLREGAEAASAGPAARGAEERWFGPYHGTAVPAVRAAVGLLRGALAARGERGGGARGAEGAEALRALFEAAESGAGGGAGARDVALHESIVAGCAAGIARASEVAPAAPPCCPTHLAPAEPRGGVRSPTHRHAQPRCPDCCCLPRPLHPPRGPRSARRRARTRLRRCSRGSWSAPPTPPSY